MHTPLELKLDGFGYADLYRSERLPLLDGLFQHWLARRDADLHARYLDYRAGASCAGPEESERLIAVAREVEDFLVAAFGVEASRDSLRAAQAREATVNAFKSEFVKRRIRKKRAQPPRAYAELERLLPGEAGDDPEWRIAQLWADATEAGDAATLDAR